jgi:hypothetical protein
MSRPRFKNEDFEFGYEIGLGGVYRGFADAGEVQATAGRVKDGDADAWVTEWSARVLGQGGRLGVGSGRADPDRL